MKVSTVIIANNGQTSGTIRLSGGRELFALIVPTLTVCDLTIDISPDNGSTWFPLYRHDGTQWELTGTTGALAIWVGSLFSFSGLPIRLASSVAQEAERSFKILED